LTRESLLIQSNERLRRTRKALLSDLSSLVKRGKRLQQSAASHVTHADGEDTNDILDEIILRALKIVNKAVRFLDVLDEDTGTQQRAAITQEGYNPPTPPIDLTTTEEMQRQSSKRISTAVHIRRKFSCHRLTASIPAAQRQKLVSERLDTSYDTFLSCLGSFIGRLHGQPQSSADILVAVRQSATVGLELLAVIEVICAHDNQTTKLLDLVRTVMDDGIKKLVSAAQNINMSLGLEDEDVVMTQQKGPLLMAATNCVRTAGDCVAKMKLIIERIGDFEFESQRNGLGIYMASMDVAKEEEETKTTPAGPRAIIPEPARNPPPPPLIIQSYRQPLEKVPSDSPIEERSFTEALIPAAEDNTTGSSTTATTPDMCVPREQSSFSNLSALAEDADDGESKILEKTYAHELLHNKEGQVTAGTLPALVERLTQHDSIPDSIFVSAFYLTFRLFVTPIELARLLVDRFDYVAESPHDAGPVRLRVYNVFKCWLESHWRDLSDHKALTVMESFAHEKLSIALPEAGRRLLELTEKVSSTKSPLVPRLVSSVAKTSFLPVAQHVPANMLLPPSNMTKSQATALKYWKMRGSNPTILEFDPLELARQLTIKEMKIFRSIMPEELLGTEWTKRSGSGAPNIIAISTLSTCLSHLVTDTVLQYKDIKKRAATIKHWIKIAYQCLELNNYSSLMAIICSLNSSAIGRLKRTWDIVPQKQKDVLKDLEITVNPDKNYAILRRRLHNHVPPCLPFLGIYLTDLTFVDEGNPAKKQLPGTGGHECISVINFDKHIRTTKIIGELQRFQYPYRLREVQGLQEWIQAEIVRIELSLERGNAKKYYDKSLLLEPRQNSNSKVPSLKIANKGRDSTAFLGHT
jgi:hypothetical protein